MVCSGVAQLFYDGHKEFFIEVIIAESDLVKQYGGGLKFEQYAIHYCVVYCSLNSIVFITGGNSVWLCKDASKG